MSWRPPSIKVASIALRINPEVDAHTHAKITTGMKENKFGINLSQLGQVLDLVCRLEHIKLIGIHCHIGSQITDMAAFRGLVIRVNEIQEELEARGIKVENLNFGGGLGIDYYHPNHLPIPAFDNYFAVFNKLLQLRPGQQVHFEPGRSIVAQCGSLISKVLICKSRRDKKFCILDAGFTELIRPAMYDAYHRMENITSDEEVEVMTLSVRSVNRPTCSVRCRTEPRPPWRPDRPPLCRCLRRGNGLTI